MLAIINGSEHIHAGTIARFKKRFAPFGLSETAMRPSYGLAEATVYVASATPGRPPKARPLRLPGSVERSGKALRNRRGKRHRSDQPWHADARWMCASSTPKPERKTRPAPSARSGCTAPTLPLATGAILNSPNAHSARGCRIPLPARPRDPGCGPAISDFICDGELFIMGRIKDLLIVDGRNHYPDDIEATIREITGGRVAAISVPDEPTERLVAIVELKNRGRADSTGLPDLRVLKREVTSAISRTHSLRVADLVLVSPGSIPITTSGKVRRAACVERYRGDRFERLDVSA